MVEMRCTAEEIAAELRAESKSDEEYVQKIRSFLAQRHMSTWDVYEMQYKLDKAGSAFDALKYDKYARRDHYKYYCYIRERDKAFLDKGALENYRTLEQHYKVLKRREEKIEEKRMWIRIRNGGKS